MNKYQQIMDRIEVTEDMRSRILSNIEERPSPSPVVIWFSKYGAIAACVAVIIGSFLIFRWIPDRISSFGKTEIPEEGVVVASAQELTEKTGILIKDIEPIAEKADKTSYQIYPSNLVEIVYEIDGDTFRLRKSEGRKELFENIAEYPEAKKLLFNQTDTTIRGLEGKYYVAEWTDKTYSYAMEFEAGKSKDEIENLVSDIMKPSAADLKAINSGIEYPREDEYRDSYEYAVVKAPHGHSVYGFGSADHMGSSYTVLDGERVLMLADRNGYTCVIVLSQNKGRWINSNYLVPEKDAAEDTLESELGKTEDESESLKPELIKPSASDLEAINSGIEYPREDEYRDSYEYAVIKAPHGHSVYGFGSADHMGSSYTVLDGERVLMLADRNGYTCVIVLSQNKGRWINSNYLVPEEDVAEGTQ